MVTVVNQDDVNKLVDITECTPEQAYLALRLFKNDFDKALTWLQKDEPTITEVLLDRIEAVELTLKGGEDQPDGSGGAAPAVVDPVDPPVADPKVEPEGEADRP